MSTTKLETSKKLFEAGVVIKTEKNWINSYYDADLQYWILIGSTLRQAKRKNSLGIKPLEWVNSPKETFSLHGVLPFEDDTVCKGFKYYPAYSTDDLLEILPSRIYQNSEAWISSGDYILTIKKFEKEYFVTYMYTNDYSEIFCLPADIINSPMSDNHNTLCEALASMVLYLLSHGYKFTDGKVRKI